MNKFLVLTLSVRDFSNNKTATQAIFGEIAADASKRQKFANNVVHFLKQYGLSSKVEEWKIDALTIVGFDSIDIDWEYPGAPDRGGKPEDTKNFVKLLETLRKTFDQNGNNYGLTFTAPSSYWYLPWFDLPNLIKYADWVNFMTYDLHGIVSRNPSFRDLYTFDLLSHRGHRVVGTNISASRLNWAIEVA